MSKIKLPTYPNDFFDFTGGLDISDEQVNKTIQEIVDEIIDDEECQGMSRSTRNTKVSVSKDMEMNQLVVEVYKNYQRKYIDLDFELNLK